MTQFMAQNLRNLSGGAGRTDANTARTDQKQAAGPSKEDREHHGPEQDPLACVVHVLIIENYAKIVEAKLDRSISSVLQIPIREEEDVQPVNFGGRWRASDQARSQ